MTYPEATHYLFHTAPLFQHIGAGAYKEGLTNTQLLDAHFGHPHRAYRTIHVAGTNGKGSVSHTLAAILQSAGLKVGLYTSPHLVDFRERIRVDGEMIPEGRVVDFVEQERAFFEPLHPSFFELATALAFKYFEEQRVDIAVVEVGLGGRLDCTNIIQPLLSVITNISFDHTQFLGTTLPQIAAEKAGIIKRHTPVVIGETNGHPDVWRVFLDKAHAVQAPITLASHTHYVAYSEPTPDGGRHYLVDPIGELTGGLGGECQEANTVTILTAVDELRKTIRITDDNIREGFLRVKEMTGLMGRWQVLQQKPLTVCDTAHNPAGLRYIAHQLEATPHRRLHLIIGMVADKDVRGSLSLLPRDAHYYLCQASVQRAIPVQDIHAIARTLGLDATPYPTVTDAYQAAQREATDDDIIYIGGSTFVVADLLRGGC